MSSAKRRRGAEEAQKKAVELAEAQQKLKELQRMLCILKQIEDLDSHVVTLTLQIGKADTVERIILAKEREKSEKLLEKREQMAKDFPNEVEIRSQIQQIESLIQDLSTPTYIDRVVSLGSPSTVEKAGLYKVQMDQKLLYDCCFPADAQPPLPLTLACRVFGEFLDNFTNESAPLDDDVCNFVVELCFDVLGRTQKFEKEAEFQKAFNLKLEGFLGLNVAIDEVTCRTPTTVVKGTTDSTVRNGDKWTTLGELKLERGCTLAQGLQSYALYVGSVDAAKELRPCFSMEVIGPTIRIGGFISFEKVAWQPLTPFMNCFYTEHDRTDMVTLCRAMCALKTALIALGSYYNEAANTITPKDVPYRLQGMDTVRIGNRLVFIVTLDNGERRIFKYCRQYGEEVHRKWEEAGFAPRLYRCETLAGGWLEVEMQYLEDWRPSSSWLETMGKAERDVLHAAIFKALNEALAIQIDGCPVAHGDMRPPNIMVKRDDSVGFDIKFIDFDWAGKVGVARYPPFLNKVLNWHPDVGAGKHLAQGHDTWGAISPSNYFRLSKSSNVS